MRDAEVRCQDGRDPPVSTDGRVPLPVVQFLVGTRTQREGDSAFVHFGHDRHPELPLMPVQIRTWCCRRPSCPRAGVGARLYDSGDSSSRNSRTVGGTGWIGYLEERPMGSSRKHNPGEDLIDFIFFIFIVVGVIGALAAACS